MTLIYCPFIEDLLYECDTWKTSKITENKFQVIYFPLLKIFCVGVKHGRQEKLLKIN